MSQGVQEAENTSGDEFEIEPTEQADPSTILQRVKEFAYYLVENIELNLNLCLNLLEEKPVPPKPNSIHTTVVSKTLSVIPKVGTAIGNAFSKGETYIFEKIDKNNSKTLADLVYHYSDHKEDIRKIIIESAIDLFYSFERQFLKLTCEEGQTKAMQKLAKDASDRMFDYFLETEQTKDISRDEITKAVLLGHSKRNKAGIREGRTVINNEAKWKTNKVYQKTGIVIVEENLFYKNKESHTEKYGHRRLLPWENIADFKENWEEEITLEAYPYSLTGKEDLIKTIRDYIMAKTPNEEAKLEREYYHNEALEDRQLKHQEIVLTFRENFNELLEDLEQQYTIIANNHNENKELLKGVSEKQTEENHLHDEITKKLQEIHVNITETKVLVELNKTVQSDITEIKTENAQLSERISAVNPEHIKNIIQEEAVNTLGDNLTTVIKEKLKKNDPGPRISREVNRNIRKLKKLF